MSFDISFTHHRLTLFRDSGFSVRNSYDKDGNILTLKRWDVGGSLEDNFSYQYISGTNKLRRVSGSVDQFFYDGNGNMIADSLNGTYNISYDHRNLIVQLYYKREVVENDRMYLRTFSEFYKYDDAGNRIKKVIMKYTGEAQDPTIEDSGDAPPGWNYELIQHYVRDVTGNELAIYNDTTVVFWNVYGLDNVGKINYSDDSWNYYLKDHLGSVRVVIDQNADIISAEDLDMWGYRMTDRVFDSDSSFYKFTGKERDVSTGYDYFGARYYDARIGKWGQVEPLLEKYMSWSPYNYGLNNPMKLVDIDGREIILHTINQETGNLLANNLTLVTGVNITFSDGKLSYDKEQYSAGTFGPGSETARDLIISAINSSETIDVGFVKSNFSRTFVNTNKIHLSYSQIEGFIAGISGNLDPNTMGYAITFIHELLHTNFGGNLSDGSKVFGDIGEVETVVNIIREQLSESYGTNYGQRLSYTAQQIRGSAYVPMDESSKKSLSWGNRPWSGAHYVEIPVDYRPR